MPIADYRDWEDIKVFESHWENLDSSVGIIRPLSVET
jgi:hypothetical protein